MSHPCMRLGFAAPWFCGLLLATFAPTAQAGLGDALDAPSLAWTTGGDALWYAANNYDCNAYLSPMGWSGLITNNQSSTLQTTVTGPGRFTFWWKVSSQTNVDYLAWLLNGVEQARISGTSALGSAGWHQVTCYLPSGSQTLQWVYSKGPSGSAGQDAGWLDHVSYTAGAFPPVITAQPVSVNGVPGTQATFSVQVSGAPPFAYQWQFNGADLPGATNSSLTFSPAQTGQSGWYRVAISNIYGSVLSSNAQLNVFTSVGPVQAQDALDRWYFRSPLQPSRVRFAGGLFFGVGPGGLLTTSPDGTNWTTRSSGTTADLTGVAFGTVLTSWPQNLFVVVGKAGTILTSGDGTTWSSAPSGTGQDLNDVAWNGSRFVASATANSATQPNVFYSGDGTVWSGVKFPNNPDSGVPFVTSTIGVAGRYFITAGGSQFAYDIWRSSNGSTWQEVGFSDAVVGGIASGNARVLVVGWEGWPRLSTDQGVSWTPSPSLVISPDGYQPPLYNPPMVGSDLTFGNGTFLVARSFLQNGFLTTADGVSWTKRNLFVGASIDSVAFGNGTFIAACSGGTYPAGIYQSELVATPFLTLSGQANAGAVTLSASGELNRSYRLQTSSDLKSWSDRVNYTYSSAGFQLVDPVTSGSTRCFYRVVSP